MMQALIRTIQQMISMSEEELRGMLKRCHVATFDKKEYLIEPGRVSNEVYFINSGLVRKTMSDWKGVEHTLHFGLEHQFLSEYTSFLQRSPSMHYIQALEPTEVVVIPRSAIEWCYENVEEGDRMGRLIAEHYFKYFSMRIYNSYAKTPSERYEMIEDIFPNIHNRVPQHMIASYLGITPVHLSRLKRARVKRISA